MVFHDGTALVLHPGYYIEWTMKHEEKSADELATISGLSTQTVNNLVRCRIDVTLTIAAKLAAALNTTIEFWTHLQRQYDLSMRSDPMRYFKR